MLNTLKVGLRFGKPLTRGQRCGDQAGRGTKSPPHAHHTRWQKTLRGTIPRTPTQSGGPTVLPAGGERPPRPCSRSRSSPGPRRPLAAAAPPHSAALRSVAAPQSGRAHARESLRPLLKRADRRVRKRASPPSRPPSAGACARRRCGGRQKGRGKETLLQARRALGAGPGSGDWEARAE